jgi:hypothetical protein
LTAALALAVPGLAACTAGVKPAQTGKGGTGNVIVGNAGTTGSGTGGQVVITGAGGQAGTTVTPPTDAGGCQQLEVKFEPKIPTVYLLVDRSGSMFKCLSGSDTGRAVCPQPANTAWTSLKEAVRMVVGTLEKDVRFGFTTIWGTDPMYQGMCPSIQGMLTDNVAPTLNNAAAIMTKYDSLQFPPESTQQGIKFESPTSQSLQAVGKALMAVTDPGEKYIIFITDGQPDYCDDSNSICAPDSVVAYIQANKTAGISTIVLGIQTALFDLPPGILQAYANAGAGEPTKAPVPASLDAFAFFDQCQNVTGWRNDMTALAKPATRGTTLGTYMPTAGPARPYMPSAADQTQLVTQLSTALAGVKSCTFDIGGTIKVNLTALHRASVAIEGTAVPLDPTSTNGWNMTSETQLQLFGSACDTWRNPNADDIRFDFPCDIIID